MVLVDSGLIYAARKALRITTGAFDDEIEDLLNAALIDLGIAGVVVPDGVDAIVKQACLTYVKVHFGEPDDYDRLKASYDEQKAQLSMATGYTDWSVIENGQE